MTRVSCPTCRLRFTSAAASHIVACPECGGHLDHHASAAEVLGFSLSTHRDDEALPAAVAVALPPPESWRP